VSQIAAHVSATPLLETKLHAPRRRRGVVHRPRLTNRLVGRDRPALTLVSAPAGFGKTTLLADWFAGDEQDRLTAWLSLDARDNDPAVFVSYLVAALQRVAPDVGATALSLLQSSPSALEAVVATLLNDLDALATDIVLVLDDYHVIESTELHEAVVFLLEHLPPQVHIVVASRADPPFPLARLRARGELWEIRVADLRFTADEAAAYFSDAMGLELTAENIDALEARTEGWIAALQLAALSMQGRDDVAAFIDSFTGDDRFVVDYLAEEVLARQPEDIRSFLLHTAVLGRMTGSLCDAVTGASGGTAMLDELDRANLFLVPLDDRRLWYRYHHLFGDVLRARLLGEQPERVHELHRRASAWYDDHGDRPEAIGHALAGEDPERAARLIELAAPAMRQARQEATLRGWLEALPEDLFQARPVLSTTLVGARMASGDTAGVEPLLQNAEQWIEGRIDAAPIVFDRNEFSRLPAQVAMYRAALALLGGDIAGTIFHANRIVELAEPSDHLLLGGAAALIGLAHWAVGELEAARTRYAEAVQHFIDAHFIPDVLGCSLALGDIQVEQGLLDGARATFEAGLEQARDRPGLRGTADMHVGLSELFLERNDLEQAAQHLHASRELGEHAGLPQHAYRWRVATARLLAVRGDLDGALELLDEAERFYNTDFSPAIRPIPALKARLHLAHGDLAAARRWANDRGLTADDDLDYVHEFEYITLARTLLADGNDRSIEAAVNLLDRLLAAAEQAERTGRAVEILVLLALARHTSGDHATAATALEEALVRAAPERFVRVFLDEGPTMTALLRSASLHGAARGHAQRVLGASSGERATSFRTGLVDELSSRELDVLRLLRSDLSGPDIARELLVSLNTLRTHTKNIYAKLGVNNRREAIRRAAELGY
jgi:LuxR family maltose regulon positive regulatory protein